MPDLVSTHQSGAVGSTAVLSGPAAAILLLRLLPMQPIGHLAAKGASQEQIEVAEEALKALGDAAAAWRSEVISDCGNAETERKSQVPDFEQSWISSTETAQILGLTVRRVCQMAGEGVLRGTREGKSWRFHAPSALALRKSRERAKSEN